MLNKILFTALLVAGVVLWLRFHNASRNAETTGPKSTNAAARRVTASATPGREDSHQSRQALITAIALALGLLLIAASYLYLDWQADHAIVQVRVVNTRSGEVSLYRARQNAVQGRQFTSLDGQHISVSDVERIETAGIQE